MENLENKSSEGEFVKSSSGTYDSLPFYEGLELVSEGEFRGKTSIKYWM